MFVGDPVIFPSTLLHSAPNTQGTDAGIISRVVVFASPAPLLSKEADLSKEDIHINGYVGASEDGDPEKEKYASYFICISKLK
jgi:hypothetical protein